MSAHVPQKHKVKVFRPDGRVRDLITTNGADDAERIRGKFAASVPPGFRVEIEPVEQPEIPDGLRPFPTEEAA